MELGLPGSKERLQPLGEMRLNLEADPQDCPPVFLWLEPSGRVGQNVSDFMEGRPWGVLAVLLGVGAINLSLR